LKGRKMNFSSSETDFVKENEAYVPVADSEKRRIGSIEEMDRLLAFREDADGGKLGRIDGRLNMKHCVIKDLDLSGRDLTGLDLSRSTFENCDLRGADFSGSKLDNVAFYDNKLTGMKLRGCLARGCSFRFQDMTDIDLRGANIYSSVLEDAINQDKVITDDETKWYKMRCPEEGEAFIAWKCCTDLRVVMMLVPRDAKRCMATMETGRVSKVKVLKITSIDETENYTWAQSTVDPDFYYEVGKWIEPANGFQEDRWKDSSPGIHFFLDRQQCVDYQSK
ncbi:MAG: pentapeptide repeat-containing protein, partial [Mogibacterium sp.]|nr:pentapeptide repeat-containing protein [Mogibacterium sp.]